MVGKKTAVPVCSAGPHLWKINQGLFFYLFLGTLSLIFLLHLTPPHKATTESITLLVPHQSKHLQHNEQRSQQSLAIFAPPD